MSAFACAPDPPYLYDTAGRPYISFSAELMSVADSSSDNAEACKWWKNMLYLWTSAMCEDVAEVCAETDRQLGRQAMLGLASSKFLEWSHEGRDVIAKSENPKR